MPRLVILQHLAREGPGLFAREAEARGWAIVTTRLDQGEPLPVVEPGDLLLVLGGPMGVADLGHPDYFWMEQEVELLRVALRRQSPVIGVCLGAQLLAVAGGGTAIPLQLGVPPHPQLEVGFGAISWHCDPGQEPLLAGLDQSELVLHWHGDRCVLPPAAQLLASSLHCREQAFRIGSRAIGLQFHVEVDPPMLETWLEEDADYVIGAIGLDGLARLRGDAAFWGERLQRRGRRLVSNLFDQLAP